jgi:glycine hydroxymethyltransferase
MNSILAKAIAFGEALSPSYADYIDRVLENAKTLAETFKNKNVRVITGGTENHIVLIDVFGSFGIAGREAQTLLEKVGLSTNANTIPGETRTPFDPSGLRLGSPAMTTRGLGVKEFQQIGNWIVEILSQPNNASVHNRIHEEVKAVCVRHPVP